MKIKANQIQNRCLVGGLALLLIVYSAKVVLAIPPLPEFYHGYAVVNDSLAPAGTSVLVEISDTGEIVGNTTTDSKGGFHLTLYFSETDNSSDNLVCSGDELKWGVNYISTVFPGIGRDTASSGEVNDLFLISTDYPPVLIVDYTPTTPTPGVFNGTSITFAATVVAPYPELVEYNWTLDGVQQSDSSSWVYSAPGNVSGTKNVGLYVSDGMTEDTHMWNLTIGRCSGVYPLSGDWNITLDTSCSNVNITLSAGSNLNVIGNVTLVFDNVTLILDNGSITAYDEGGSDSTIQSIINTIIDWIT